MEDQVICLAKHCSIENKESLRLEFQACFLVEIHTSISIEIPWKTSFGSLRLNILCKYMESHDRHDQQQHGPCVEQPCKDLLAVLCWVLVIHWIFLQLDVITMDAAGVVEGT